ncbi:MULTISPECIES: class I SAM-dependent methyltransferase [unclassified Sphingobium]|uniref:Eco57I restriction-modification methylase domain-containing protein n=1 Tax=unclassified Sphingobium TaxID=2611147 RepID=UPI00222438C1|nr:MULTISPECIES: class I SAM-dependent methyltransferase [unclassified Sphingobium]MCW2395187.1 tRNA1(Val) A37 N6-methylase TrmN6 [Sphingobium sp. B8D3B]MCW2418701.1 tRNA1(Val) A37 N6-methylase TrmN6 [Sphingobium sp. B8D3C]
MNFALSLDRRASVRLTGAVYTPSAVAAALVAHVRGQLPERPLDILEPSVGDGAFLGQLAHQLGEHSHVAVDIDAAVIAQLRSNPPAWPPATTFHARDFVAFACDAIEAGNRTFDLVVGNPPFIRKHNFPPAFKASLERLTQLTGYRLADLKNSWAAFLLASAQLVSDDGMVAFILPYELITVAYGQAALSTMREMFARIELFVSDEKAFPEIEQDAVIFVGYRAPAAPNGVFIERVRQMSDLSAPVEFQVELAPDRALALDLNAFLIEPELMPVLRALQAELPAFATLATSAPGVVTAANDFFILKDSEVAARGLGAHVLPILKKQHVLDRSPVFSEEDFAQLAAGEPCRLLHLKGELAEFAAPVRDYLATGVEARLHERYKCRNRRNWYEVRLVPPAPGFFFKRSHGYPRMCLNAANVHITDTAYGIRPRAGFTIRGLCFSFYNSLTMLFAETNGRFYGGGVLELAPSELKSLPMVYHEPDDAEFDAFLAVHRAAGGDPAPILNFGDAWLARQPQAAGLDLGAIRRAWTAVRAHRMRHASRKMA